MAQNQLKTAYSLFDTHSTHNLLILSAYCLNNYSLVANNDLGMFLAGFFLADRLRFPVARL